MKKRLVLFMMLLSIFLFSSLVSAVDVIDSHGITPDTLGSITVKEGIGIITNKDINLKYIIKSSSTTATRCYLFNESTGWGNLNSDTPIATGTFSGDNCSLNYNISAGTNYSLAVDDLGGSYTRHYNNCGVGCGYPISGTNVNFSGGRQGTTLYSDYMWDVLQVGSEEISDFFIITAFNNITMDPILNFTANVSGQVYESNNTGQIVTGFQKSTATLENITLNSFGYYNETYDRHRLLDYIRQTVRESGATIFDEMEGLFATWERPEQVAFFQGLYRFKIEFPAIVVTRRQFDFARLLGDPNQVCEVG